MEVTKKIRIRNFLLVMIAFAIVSCVYFFEYEMNAQNTTALAMSYKYGFIPRGFVGSILQGIKLIFGIDLFTYHRVYLFTGLVTFIFFVILFVLYYICLSKTTEKHLKLIELIIVFSSVFMFPEFMSWNNFGRLDEYLMIVELLCIILLLLEKWEYLLIPLCCISGLIHVGCVFTNVNVILILLIWKVIEKRGKERKKYLIILGSCFACVSILFLYFQVFQGAFDSNVYHDIVALAKSISKDGQSISDSLLDSEILKLDVFQDEWIWHRVNYMEFPIFLVFFSPYIVIAIKFFKGLLNKAETKLEKWKYIFVLIGVGTILPSLILKVDYGRWMFCIITYYCFMVLALCVLGDQKLIEQCYETIGWIKKKVPCYSLLVFYPLLFMPFRDVAISDISLDIMMKFANMFGIPLGF